VLIFISYAHEDSGLVDDICTHLSGEGFEFFRDTKSIGWGGKISRDVQRALEQSGGVVVVLSPASIKSQWVPYEVGYAIALRKPILPYLTHPSLDLPGYLSDLRHISTLDEIASFLGQVDATGQAAVASAEGVSDAAMVAARIAELSPGVQSWLAELHNDLAEDETGLIREFVLLPNRRISVTQRKKRFAFYEEEHPNLQLVVDRLQDMGLVTMAEGGQFPAYRMTSGFVSAVRGQAQ
jgi:nucleoside 2-deoxyribosyltransferase